MRLACKIPDRQNFLSSAKTTFLRGMALGCMTIPCFSGLARAQGQMAYFGEDPRALLELHALAIANDARNYAQSGNCADAATVLIELGQDALETTKFADTPETIIRAQLFSDHYFKTLFDVAQSCPVIPPTHEGTFDQELLRRGKAAVRLAKDGKCETARLAADAILSETNAKSGEYQALSSKSLQQGVGRLPPFQNTPTYTLGHIVGPAVMGICLGDKAEPNKWLNNMVDAINQEGGLKSLAPAINQRLNNQGWSPN